LSGIASGVGVGVIRGVSTGSFYASNTMRSLTPHIHFRSYDSRTLGHRDVQHRLTRDVVCDIFLGSIHYFPIKTGCRHLCQKQIADERKKVAKIIESMPQRSVKQAAEEMKGSVTESPA
jgi:hypothetical protein